MKDILKKDIIKWLDTEIIYPIFDSVYVSLIEYVPKKGGMIMVENEKNELIPTKESLLVRRYVWYIYETKKGNHKGLFPLPLINQMLD